MSSQSYLTDWSNTGSIAADSQQPTTETSILDQAIEYAKKLKEDRLREIPSEERYPIHWGRLRSYNQSPRTLGELDPGTHRPYARDDRAYPNWEDHFVEVVILDD